MPSFPYPVFRLKFFLTGLLCCLLHAPIITNAQHIGFEGMVFVTVDNHGIKDHGKSYFRVFFHDGQVCIDSIKAGNGLIKLIIDQESGKIYNSYLGRSTGVVFPVSWMFSALSERFTKYIPDSIDAGHESLVIRQTGKTKKLWGYPCRELTATINYMKKNTMESAKMTLWMTDSAGIKLKDFTPLADTVFNNFILLKKFENIPRIITPFFINSFPVEMTIQLNPRKKEETTTISFWIYKDKVDKEKFDISQDHFLSEKESKKLILKNKSEKK